MLESLFTGKMNGSNLPSDLKAGTAHRQASSRGLLPHAALHDARRRNIVGIQVDQVCRGSFHEHNPNSPRRKFEPCFEAVDECDSGVSSDSDEVRCDLRFGVPVGWFAFLGRAGLQFGTLL